MSNPAHNLKKQKTQTLQKKNDMEKETLQSALAEFPQVPTVSINNVKNFLAVMTDGSIQQMSKADMASVLGG